MAANIITTEGSVDVADLVEDLQGTYTARNKAGRPVEAAARTVADRIRNAVECGAVAEMHIDDNGWTVRLVSADRSTGYGVFTYNG